MQPGRSGVDRARGAIRAPWPLSHSIVYNLTVIGSTPDSGVPLSAIDFAPVSPNARTRGCQMRNGFAGELRNSIVVNTGTALGFDIGAGGAPGYTTQNNVAADYDGDALGDLVRLYCTDGRRRRGARCGRDQRVQQRQRARRRRRSDNNVVNSAGFPALIEEDQTFNPTGNAAGKLDATLLGANGLLNPRPRRGLTGVGGCAGPSEPGTDGNAVYRGAFIRTAPTLWTTGLDGAEPRRPDG